MKLSDFIKTVKIIKGNSIKQYILGIPVYKRKKRGDKIKIYLLGIPVFKVKNDSGKIKIYLFNLKLFSFTNFSSGFYSLPAESDSGQEYTAERNILNIKAFEIINSRMNCRYEKGENQ